jgi:aspartate/glutamate racemase
MVFPELALRPPRPLVGIVEATCAYAASLGLRRLSISETRFTMQGSLYTEALAAAGSRSSFPKSRSGRGFIRST